MTRSAGRRRGRRNPAVEASVWLSIAALLASISSSRRTRAGSNANDAVSDTTVNALADTLRQPRSAA